jgi:hypothetical protein
VVSHSFTDVQLRFEWMVFPAHDPPGSSSLGTSHGSQPCSTSCPSSTSSHDTAVTPKAAAAVAAGGGGGDRETQLPAARGHVCQLWSHMAEAAVWQHGCQLVVLLGEWPGRRVVSSMVPSPCLILQAVCCRRGQSASFLKVHLVHLSMCR